MVNHLRQHSMALSDTDGTEYGVTLGLADGNDDRPRHEIEYTNATEDGVTLGSANGNDDRPKEGIADGESLTTTFDVGDINHCCLNSHCRQCSRRE